MIWRESLFIVSADLHLDATERLRKVGQELIRHRDQGQADASNDLDRKRFIETEFRIERLRWHIIDKVTKWLDPDRPAPIEPV